mmetsp:Transcript_34972/g.107411  ORF Transcript_34972/g.107411 Transcript_34972/m.107411 type:complete len:276 (+) Transcript_34972:595-1422(+)
MRTVPSMPPWTHSPSDRGRMHRAASSSVTVGSSVSFERCVMKMASDVVVTSKNPERRFSDMTPRSRGSSTEQMRAPTTAASRVIPIAPRSVANWPPPSLSADSSVESLSSAGPTRPLGAFLALDAGFLGRPPFLRPGGAGGQGSTSSSGLTGAAEAAGYSTLGSAAAAAAALAAAAACLRAHRFAVDPSGSNWWVRFLPFRSASAGGGASSGTGASRSAGGAASSMTVMTRSGFSPPPPGVGLVVLGLGILLGPLRIGAALRRYGRAMKPAKKLQ